MKKLVLVALALLLVLTWAAACGGRDGEPTPSPAAPASDQPAARSTGAPAAPTNTPAPAAQADRPTPTPEPTEEPLRAIANLDNLRSYRTTTRWAIKGVNAEGNPVDEGFEVVTAYVKDPRARYSLVRNYDNTDPAAGETTTEVYEIGQEAYMRRSDEAGWLRFTVEDAPTADDDLNMMASGDIFDNLDQMKRVRPDQKIAGLDSRHYQFDEKVLGRLLGEGMGEVTAKGDLWIAKDGGFITKYTLVMEVKGGSDFASDLTEGTIEISFELQEVNGDVKVELPAEARAATALPGFEDQPFPMPADAKTQVASAQAMIFLTGLSVDETVAFYEAALADLGWAKDPDRSMRMEGMSLMAFTKDNQRLSITVLVDSSTGQTQVMASPQ
ncbi:MAG: hypothetical protein NZ528_03150 [Caldilineales bacterium]|nr:hypothetical protein [Caldilineales bacterium]